MKPKSSFVSIVLSAVVLATGCPEEPELELTVGGADMSLAIADIVGVPNIDDDDGDGAPDWQEPPEDDDDFTVVSFVEDSFPEMDDGWSALFRLRGDRDAIRIHHAGNPVLGYVDGEEVREWTVRSEPSELMVEFGEYLATGTLEVEIRDEDGEIVKSTSGTLMASPLIVHTHMQTSTHVWATDLGDSNADFIAGYEDALGDRFTAVSGRDYQWDPWMQDELEYASTSGPGGVHMEIVIDSIRDRGLAPFVSREIEGPGSARGVWGDPREATSQDSFGNLEVTPPVTVDGVSYPYGRVYYGWPDGADDWWVGEVHPELKDFLDSQVVQAPMQVDVGWLCVGHVDEYISWVPDPLAPKGFWMLVADTVSAYEILDSMDPATRLPRYSASDGHGYGTVGQIVRDEALRRENAEVQEDHIDRAVEQFKAEAGVDEEDIIRIPDIFEQVPGYGGCYAAMIPGMVNMIIANFGEGDDHLFMADPFVRQNLNDQSRDPFIAHMHEILPSSYELHFLDNWEAYHAGLGEVHCGTNVQREPAGDWWNSAAHLLEDLAR